MSDIQEISARQAAKRYAELTVAAVAADERITELQKRVEDAEYYRNLAEAQLSAATWPEGIGQVIHVGTDEPDESVWAILDIYSGQIYRRAERGGDAWVRAEVSESGATRYSWPIEEDGPFLKLQDEWYVRKLIDAVRQDDERRLKLRDRFRSEPGYYPEGENQFTWNQIDPADGAIRAFNAMQAKWSKAETENHDLQSKLRSAEREIEMWKEQLGVEPVAP